MKPFVKTNIMGLLPILFVLCFTIYFSAINFKYPLVGIEVIEQNDQWIVETIYEKGWANNQPINEGDILKFVNGENPKGHSTVSLFNRVEKLKSITIVNQDL